MDLGEKIGMALLVLGVLAMARHAYIVRRRLNRQWGKGWRKKVREGMGKPID